MNRRPASCPPARVRGGASGPARPARPAPVPSARIPCESSILPPHLRGTTSQAIDFNIFFGTSVPTDRFDLAPRAGMRYGYPARQADALSWNSRAQGCCKGAGYPHRTPTLSQRYSVPCALASRRGGFPTRITCVCPSSNGRVSAPDLSVPLQGIGNTQSLTVRDDRSPVGSAPRPIKSAGCSRSGTCAAASRPAPRPPSRSRPSGP